MNPTTVTDLRRLYHWVRRSRINLRHMENDLRSASDGLPSEFAEIHSAMAHCQNSIQELWDKIEAEYETNETLHEYWWNESLSETDVHRLLALNRQLRDVGVLPGSVADDVRPRLENKVADPNDPMYDYEIEAKINFILREDDPEHSEDDDNILASRSEWLTCKSKERRTDYSEPIGPEGLRAEPHCWLFHDLYDHEYGEGSHRLSFRDCLRIGKILIDVQVWQQYSLDVATLPCGSDDRVVEDGQ